MRAHTRMLMPCLTTMFVALTAFVATGLTTDKRLYDVGEPVVFTLANESQNVMRWESISYYPVVSLLLDDEEEEVVRELTLFVLEALSMLMPGDAHTWEWDQRDYHQWYDMVDDLVDRRTQVPPGRYVARFKPLAHGEFETLAFTICLPSDAEPRG